MERVVKNDPHLQPSQILNTPKTSDVKRLEKLLASNEAPTVIDPRKDEMMTYSGAIKLLEEKKCKNCKTEERDMLFLPCGHLTCCLIVPRS